MTAVISDLLRIFIPAWILWSCTTVSGEGDDTLGSLTADTPNFVTRGGVYRAIIGDTIILPCQAEKLGRYLLLWKRGNSVLSAGDLKVSVDPRIQLIDGFKLEIKKVRIHDAGDYICQMNTLTPQDQIHTLEVLVPPSVRTEPSNTHVTITQGDSMTLKCRANGNPMPQIRWSRQNNLLPTGEQSIEGNSFSIEKAARHHAGIYVCSASNGVGTPVSTSIQVKVQYPPEIEVERTTTHSGVGHEAELACIVHSDPHSTVRWFRDTLILHTTDRRLVENRGSRHSLIIRKVHASDFGNYSCEADNKLGRSKKHIELTGKPEIPRFRSDPKGNMRDSFNITWTVESFVPIQEYRLLYRKAYATTNDTRLQGFGTEWTEVVLPAGEYGLTHQHGNSLTNSMAVASSSLVPIIMSKSGASVHIKFYLIKNLEPHTIYEGRVAAKNMFGYSQSSELFSFRTSKTELLTFDGSPRNDLFTDPELRDMGFTGRSSSALLVCTKLIFWTSNICTLLFSFCMGQVLL